MGEVVETFVGQFYLQEPDARCLLRSCSILILTIKPRWRVASELAGVGSCTNKPRGDRARYLKLARTNAATALTTKPSLQSTVNQRLTALQRC
ncbi:MAG: hypothetical protein ACLTXH_13590 [Enterobacter hormaechei]